jgi:hypothetical protein
MGLIIAPILAAVVGVIVLVVKFGCEQHANNERIRRGETPKKYHDLTDASPPVNVIDWSKH